MPDFKKENASSKNDADTIGEDVAIHTMREDLDALSGIFHKDKKTSSRRVKDSNVERDKKTSEEPKRNQYFNPFLDKQVSEKQKQEQDKIASFAASKAVQGDSASNQWKSQKSEKSDNSSKKTIWVAIILIIMGSFVLGGYYFFSKSNAIESKLKLSKTEETAETEAQNSEGNNEPTTETEPSTKYSFDKPNYLSIDTENPSYENFKEVISQALSDVKGSGIDKPVEFVITDNKNDPIAFPIFSAITKLGLSNALLKNLNDDFSVFAYYDSGNPRLALSIGVIDESKASALIKSEEAKLPAELASLFLDNVSLPKGRIVFQEANYKGIDIRYFNFTQDQLFTTDYSFNDAHLIIGTSKLSMWAVLDKILNEKQQ